jgi:hypothetical protein
MEAEIDRVSRSGQVGRSCPGDATQAAQAAHGNANGASERKQEVDQGGKRGHAGAQVVAEHPPSNVILGWGSELLGELRVGVDTRDGFNRRSAVSRSAGRAGFDCDVAVFASCHGKASLSVAGMRLYARGIGSS